MQALANFVNLLLEGLLFVACACAMGGLVWGLLLGGPWSHQAAAEQGLLRRSMTLLRWGALGMAAIQLAKQAVHAWLLAESFRHSPFPAYFETLPWQTGVTRASLAVGMAAAGWWVARQPKALLPWSVTGFLAILLAASGAWLAHAALRR